MTTLWKNLIELTKPTNVKTFHCCIAFHPVSSDEGWRWTQDLTAWIPCDPRLYYEAWMHNALSHCLWYPMHLVEKVVLKDSSLRAMLSAVVGEHGVKQGLIKLVSTNQLFDWDFDVINHQLVGWRIFSYFLMNIIVTMRSDRYKGSMRRHQLVAKQSTGSENLFIFWIRFHSYLMSGRHTFFLDNPSSMPQLDLQQH